jgi:hypothetical protein
MRIATASVVLGLLACTPNDPQPAQPAQPAVAPPAVDPAEPPEVPAEPAPAPAPATPDDPPATPGDPLLILDEPPAAPSDLHVVAVRNGDLHVFDLGGELIVGGAGALARPTADGSLERIDALRGLVDPGYMMLAGWSLEALGGRWPDPVWMTTQTHYQRSDAPAHMYYRKGDRWQRKATATGPLHWYYAAFAPWQTEQVLALRMHAPDQQALEKYGSEELPPAVQRKLDAALAANPPRLDVLAAGAAPVAAPLRLAPGGLPLALATAPTGEVHVLLQFSENTESDGLTYKHAVQRFAPGAADGALDSLAGLVTSPTALAVRAADDVLVGGDSLARFDGRTWTKLPGPKGRVSSLSLGEPGVQWAIASNPDYDGQDEVAETTLWRQTGAGRWTKVKLAAAPSTVSTEPRWVYDPGEEDWKQVQPGPDDPGLVAPQTVLARGRGDVWVAGLVGGIPSADGSWHRHAVLHTRKPARVLEFPDDATLRGELLDVQAVKPWRPEDVCDGANSPWVLIERLAPGAAVDPTLVDALRTAVPEDLRGTLVSVRESRVEGHRVVGLFADPPDAPAVKRILAALDQVRPGVKRQFECRNPRPITVLGKYE